MLYLAFILYFVKLYTAHPVILDELNSCNYNSSNDDTYFTSKLWRVEHNNVIIYYTLCGYVQNTICNNNKGVAACIKNKKHNSFDVLGKKFTLGNDMELSLESEHGSICKGDPKKRYKLKIKFGCFEEMKETRLEISNDCEYIIYMMNPRSCHPKCTTNVNGELIDLRPLKGDFFVQSAGRNFSITLCGSNQICSNTDKGVSMCEITNGSMIPLSAFKNEIMVFTKEKNNLTIRGSYKRNKDKRKVELIIKCSWDHNSTKIVYKTPTKSRKNYKFEMESSFGCIKLPPSCVITTENFLIYNLTNLHNDDGYLRVSNVPNGEIYLNICGPLHLPLKSLNIPKNNCSRAFSQVCEVNNGNFLNKGSILSNLEIVDDVIKATFINGATCKDLQDSSRQYNTHIELFCSKTEEGPKFIRSEICDTFIHWNTPLACPSYNKSSCTYIHQEFQNCSINSQEKIYDLRPLTLNNRNYDVQDSSDGSTVYYLNVCGPVTVSDAPCYKHSMVVMKDLDQTNIKHRFKSLGKMDTMRIVNGDVVIKTSSGSYCGEEGDYRSVITFICNSIEVMPKLLNRTECTFQFEWKTPHACPIMHHLPEKKCLFQNAANISLNFAKMKETSLKVNLNKTYTFDLCKENYKECLKEKCDSFSVVKMLSTHNGKTYLELVLPKKCETKTEISMVLFELICDNIINNEHFKFIRVENCTLEMELFTNLICPGQDVVIDMHQNHKNEEYILKEQISEIGLENCSISNHVTGYKFYISNLQLNIPILRCPVVSFHNENSSVMLTYSDGKICQGSKQSGTFEYRVILKCSKDDLNDLSKKTECSEIYEFEKPEFCKLFETSILDSAAAEKSDASSTGKIIGSVAGISILFGTCVLCFLLHRKYRRKTYDYIYEKGG